MHRWCKEHCPGSIAQCRGKVEGYSPAAEEGTRAHKRFESRLSHQTDHLPSIDTDVQLKPTSAKAVDVAVQSVIQSKLHIIALEDRVEINKWCYGTADVVAIRGAHLVVIDYKNGQIPVDAINNMQLLTYSWGAFLKYFKKYHIDQVEMHIIQPRAKNGKCFGWDTRQLHELYDHGVYIDESISAAMDKNAPRRTGYWCQFCAGFADCPEYQLAETEREIASQDDKTLDAMSVIEQFRKRIKQ